eukprot:9649394-Lingulodinium_polyedra.AAC.1
MVFRIRPSDQWHFSLGPVGFTACLSCKCLQPVDGAYTLAPMKLASVFDFQVILKPEDVEAQPTKWSSPISQRLKGVAANVAGTLALAAEGEPVPLIQAAALD